MTAQQGPNGPFGIVTIDGPAGSGKSSTAREVARRLGYRHLDSGALYRTLTLALLREGVPGEVEAESDLPSLTELDLRIEPEGEGFQILLDGAPPGPALRSEEVTRLAPRFARFASVRARLLALQRSAVHFGGVVADGRDMGTVVFPEAGLKVFLTAALEERAKRRLLQEGRGTASELLESESDRIRERDRSDTDRAVAPLRPADGALLLDTTALSFEAQVERIVEAARALG